jgi:hypothetical protein
MSFHRGRDGSQVLADDHALALRLDAEHRMELVLAIADVHALLRVHPIRHDEESIERHHVIEPEDTGVLEMSPQRRCHRRVPVSAHAVRMHRRKAPALPLREEDVRRRAGGRFLDERVRELPDVEPSPDTPSGKSR